MTALGAKADTTDRTAAVPLTTQLQTFEEAGPDVCLGRKHRDYRNGQTSKVPNQNFLMNHSNQNSIRPIDPTPASF